MSVEMQGVTVRLDGRLVLDGIDAIAPADGLTGLIGPNGSGKSTLLRTLFRARRPDSGTVRIGGRDIWSIPARHAARQVAVVLQDLVQVEGATLEEVVALGRIPHRGTSTAAVDRALVEGALAQTGITELRTRQVATLSGGQRQRMQLARALTQATPVLLLDEPTNHLDVRARIELLGIARGRPGTTIAALHDLDLAAAHCDHLIVLQRGRLVAAGPPAEILTPRLIADVYGVDAEIGTNPLTGRPTVHVGDRLHLPPHRQKDS